MEIRKEGLCKNCNEQGQVQFICYLLLVILTFIILKQSIRSKNNKKNHINNNFINSFTPNTLVTY